MAGQLTGAMSTQSPAEAGFSLIEVLVVTAILAVLAVGVSLATVGPPNAINSDVASFHQRFEALRSRAIQGQQIEGLFITPRGHQTAIREHNIWQTSGTEMRWSARVLFRPKDQPLVPLAPDVLFLPNGSYSPFLLEFVSRVERIRCDGDGWDLPKCGPI